MSPEFHTDTVNRDYIYFFVLKQHNDRIGRGFHTVKLHQMGDPGAKS